MLELRVEDLRMRGRGFTLSVAARENEVDEDLMDFLVSAIYRKLGLDSGDYNRDQAIRQENPNILDTISKKDLEEGFSYKGYGMQELVSNGLVEEKGEDLELTEKAVNILKRAAEIQNQLDDEGFHFCPCCM